MESTTRLITIPDYSNLVRLRAAGSPQRAILETFHFRGHVWRITLYPVALSSYLDVCDDINDVTRQQSRSASYTKIYIEILDESGEHTVFDKEHTLGDNTWFKSMLIPRTELEASSCVRNDSFTVRCTLSFLTTSFSEPTMIFKEPNVVLAGSHTLTIDSFSKHKAALGMGECVRSTRFSVGGSTWYIKLKPSTRYDHASKHYGSPSLLLTRASSDELATTVEFNFELLAGDDGGKYYESRKVTHMFNRASPEHALLVPSTWMAKHDHFIVRYCLVVIRTEMPIPCSESVLTLLSRRSSCLAVTKAGMPMPCSEPVLTPLSSDEPTTTAKFNFELLAPDDGGKYHEYTKVTRTFDRASPEHAQPVSSTSTAEHDSFCTLSLHSRKLSNYLKNLRSFFKPMMIFKEPKVVLARSHKLMIDSFSKHKAVIKAEMSMPRSESLLTPLLGCHDVRST